MPKLRAHNIATSLDGFSAGAEQTLEEPMGIGGEGLHDWIFSTKSWMTLTGQEGGEEGLDNDFLDRGWENIGATIMGRNMFGPVRGPWPDDEWKGWWGDNPPYHHPVFVLTNYAREPIEMEGGTTFYFVTDGIEAALARAMEAAGGKDVRLGGGVSTIQQYMRAGLLDELHVPFVPVVLGRGERLFEGIDGPALGYEVAEKVTSPRLLHVVLRRSI